MPAYDYHLKIYIPLWLDRLLASVLLLYRRLRYGYAFRRIKLTKGRYAIVDPQDYCWLSRYKWHSGKAPYAKRTVTVNGKQKDLFMHREIMKAKLASIGSVLSDNLVVDHINRNSLDNRNANLRPVTKKQDIWNRGHIKTNTSGYKGVHWRKDIQKWRVRIGIDGKRRTLGYFDDEIQAAKVYDTAAKKHRGEFAALNFPKNR